MNNYKKNIDTLKKIYDDNKNLNKIEMAIMLKYNKNNRYLMDLGLLLDDTNQTFNRILKKLTL